MAEDVVIVGGARTPFCEWQGEARRWPTRWTFERRQRSEIR